MEKVELGKTRIMVSTIGIGAWSWGDKFYWSYGNGYGETDVRRVFNSAVQAGINFFDTAEAYGRGRSEQILGELARSTDAELHLATKFAPYPWRLQSEDLKSALSRSLKRLDVDQVALYQIHFPVSLRSANAWVAALGKAVGEGQSLAAGVSNFSRDQMLRAHDILQRMGVNLASNQVEYHLLNRKVEYQGLLQACRDNGITLIAYSPLAQGLLTGKYSPNQPPPGIRRFRYSRSLLLKAKRLVDIMLEIGSGHSGKTPSQVSINWLLAKGVLPIPGVKNLEQFEEIIGAAGWSLHPDEVAALDACSEALN